LSFPFGLFFSGIRKARSLRFGSNAWKNFSRQAAEPLRKFQRLEFPIPHEVWESVQASNAWKNPHFFFQYLENPVEKHPSFAHFVSGGAKRA